MLYFCIAMESTCRDWAVVKTLCASCSEAVKNEFSGYHFPMCKAITRDPYLHHQRVRLRYYEELNMPLYEYDCKQCASKVEILVRSPEESIACPTCGSTKLEKLLSVAAAPSVGSTMPIADAAPNCGKPQCQSGCMFEGM